MRFDLGENIDMVFIDTVNYIYSLTNLERDRNLFIPTDGIENVKYTLKLLEVEHERKTIVHIAGTKGKGTVSSLIAKLLSRYSRVGLYTSPHLCDIRERICIVKNDRVEMISKEEFSYYSLQIRKVIEENRIKLTTFDFLTVLAVLFFDRKGIENIVLEVGLGGRLDSTNFCIPKVSVITKIDYDHTNILGNTLDKIAYEKAGIIKDNKPVFSLPQDDQVKHVLEKKSLETNSKLLFIDDRYRILSVKVFWNGTFATVKTNVHSSYIPRFSLRKRPRRYRLQIANSTIKFIKTNLIGTHNIQNILLAYEIVRYLHPRFRLPNEVFLNIKGRFEILKKNPRIVFDVAHSPVSVENLLSNLSKLSHNFDVMISLLKDKSIEKIVEVLGKYGSNISSIFVLKIDDPSDGSEKIYELLSSKNFSCQVIETVEIDKIANDTVIFGSFRVYEKILSTLRRLVT